MSFLHHRRFSNLSALTVSTVGTALPEYTVTEDAQIPEGPDDSDRLTPSGSTSQASPLPRYSRIVNPRHSILLTWVPGLDQDLIPDDGFCYSLPIKTWATLQLCTRDNIPGNPAPSAAQPKVPRFWGSEPIAGVLHLGLTRPHSINDIKIMVKGRLRTFSMGWKSLKFLASEHILWKRSSHGDPRQTRSPLAKEKFDDKLVGRYSFPFSFPFPSRLNLLDEKPFSDATISPFLDNPSHCRTPPKASPTQRGNGEKESSSETKDVLGVSSADGISPFTPVDHAGSSSIPQTFFEKDVPESISYELSVHITHGKLKPATSIKTDISYVPASQPLPASKRRQKAYEAGASVPGPFDDSDGWFPTPSSTIRGAFNSSDGGQRQFEIDCRLYIAQPLSFTRGTVIPCFLALSSDEADALGSLPMRNVPRLVLMRRLRRFVTKAEDTHDHEVQVGYNAFQVTGSYAAGNIHPKHLPGVDLKVGKTLHIKTMLHEVGTAVWWFESSSDEVQGEPNTRHLQGEIHLPANLEPSCACKIFNFEYYVEMLSPRFVSKLDRSPVSRRSLATVPIDITSLCRTDEPVPIPFNRPPPRVHVRQISSDGV